MMQHAVRHDNQRPASQPLGDGQKERLVQALQLPIGGFQQYGSMLFAIGRAIAELGDLEIEAAQRFGDLAIGRRQPLHPGLTSREAEDKDPIACTVKLEQHGLVRQDGPYLGWRGGPNRVTGDRRQVRRAPAVEQSLQFLLPPGDGCGKFSHAGHRAAFAGLGRVETVVVPVQFAL